VCSRHAFRRTAHGLGFAGGWQAPGDNDESCQRIAIAIPKDHVPVGEPVEGSEIWIVLIHLVFLFLGLDNGVTLGLQFPDFAPDDTRHLGRTMCLTL
jgi:hypothetical protein